MKSRFEIRHDSEPAICPSCGSDCERVLFGTSERYLCDPCAKSESVRMKADARRAECMALLAAVVPKIYREPLKPDLVCPAYLPALECNPRLSFALIGPSDTGKTRVAYHMLRKASEMGLKPFAVSAAAFRRSASDRSAVGYKELLIMTAQAAQVLLIDDLGKGMPSEAADEALLDLLSVRRDYGRATYFTFNGGGKDWMVKKYGSDFGMAIAMRIASMCGHKSGQPMRIYRKP